MELINHHYQAVTQDLFDVLGAPSPRLFSSSKRASLAGLILRIWGDDN